MTEQASRKRYNIDRRMVGILTSVALLGVCLVFSLFLATQSVIAMRAFSSLQTVWTESRKDAAQELIRYIDRGSSAGLASYRREMRRIEKASEVKEQIQRDNPDMAVVRSNLTDLHVRDADIENMVTTYKRFGSFEVFEDALANWKASDSLVYRYNKIAAGVTGAELDSTERVRLAARVNTIDEELDQMQYQLATYLGEGASLLRWLIFGVSIFLGVILLAIAGIFSFRFRKSIKNWSKQLRESEQRYRSLFEENPHAVFAMDRDGKIEGGNESFKTLFKKDETGYTLASLHELLEEQPPDKRRQNLETIGDGHPLNLELQWKRGGEKDRMLHLTVMPIVVDQSMQGMFGIAEDITFEKRASQKIKAQLEEKTVLLAEIHHRVKNNLAVICGLLELQQDALQEEAALQALTEAKMRVQGIAMVHEQIYQNATLANIDFHEYLQQLVPMITHSYDLNSRAVDIELNIAEVSLSMDQSIPCGLIVNELISNAYEHAFEEEGGAIRVSLHERDGVLTLAVADNGTGLPDKDWEQLSSGSLGLTLVETLTQQIDGELDIEVTHGTRFIVTFPAAERNGSTV